MTAPVQILDLNSRLKLWLFDHALPLWWEVGFDRDKGGCFEKIGQDGRAIEGPRRARVAARQAWVYAEAGKLGWTGPWREARDHALEALTTTFARDDGLFRILAESAIAAGVRRIEAAAGLAVTALFSFMTASKSW